MTEKIKQCLICEKDIRLECSGKDSTVIPAAYDATVWRTTGNYGSTLFDPFDESAETYLEAFVCDGCLKAKASRMEKVVAKTVNEVISRTNPEF
jgi:hypothetical protein